MSTVRPGDVTPDTPVAVLRYYATFDGPVASAARRELTRRGIGPDTPDVPLLQATDPQTVASVGDYAASLHATVSTASKTVTDTAPAVADAEAARSQLTRAQQELDLFTATDDAGKILLVQLANGRAQIHDARVQLTNAVTAQRNAVTAVQVAITAAQVALEAATAILQAMPAGASKDHTLAAMGAASPAVDQLAQVELVAQQAADAVTAAQRQLAQIADAAQSTIEGAVYAAVTSGGQ